MVSSGCRTAKRKRALSRKLDFLLQDYREKVLVLDENVAAEWGRYVSRLEIEMGEGLLEQLDYPDTQIPATALAYGLVIVTNNEKDFPALETLNPWLEA